MQQNVWAVFYLRIFSDEVSLVFLFYYIRTICGLQLLVIEFFSYFFEHINCFDRRQIININ